MLSKKIAGFSLIELMIVVTIIGILIMSALPSYKSYTQRARFAEVITATDPFKTAIALGLQQGLVMSDLTLGKNGVPDAPTPTQNLASLDINNGAITATSTEIAGNATIILTPNEEGTQWTITGTCVNLGLCNH